MFKKIFVIATVLTVIGASYRQFIRKKYCVMEMDQHMCEKKMHAM